MRDDKICTFCLLHGHTASSCPSLRKTLADPLAPRESKVERMHAARDIAARKQVKDATYRAAYDRSPAEAVEAEYRKVPSPSQTLGRAWREPCKVISFKDFRRAWPEDDTDVQPLPAGLALNADYSEMELRVLAHAAVHGIEHVTLDGTGAALQSCPWDTWKSSKDLA